MTNEHTTLAHHLTLYIRSLAGENVSAHTVTAYHTDLRQFLTWIAENDLAVIWPDQVQKSHISEYLSHLADQRRSGVTRGRKLAALREFFKFLVVRTL
jgi:integrase/recombinase XerC